MAKKSKGKVREVKAWGLIDKETKILIAIFLDVKPIPAKFYKVIPITIKGKW